MDFNDLPNLPWHHRVRRRAARVNEWASEAQLYDRILPTAFLGGVLLFLVYMLTFAAPLDFPSASLLKVPQGMSVGDVAKLLKEKHLIHSTLLFEAASRLQPGETKVIAGEYFFPGPQDLFTVASRLARGDHELIPIKVRIPEGATAKQITQLLQQDIPDFEVDAFYAAAQPKEGRLFPDTYFFLPGEDVDLVLTALENNFQQHITEAEVAAAIEKFGKPLSDVLVMASLLEKEGSNTEDRRIISGVLWHRIALGMPLQVDAVFPYIIGVNSLQLTKDQLQTDSPYNTYTHKGLPPGPIANPSVDSILAAVTPTKSNYLYYLSDLHSQMHYCATYSCQLDNAAKYLGH